MSRGDERSAGRQRGDTYYKERRGHGHGKDDEDNERWRVRNRWAKTYLFHVRIEYFTLGDHAASNRGPDLRHGCIRAPRGLAFLASIEGYRCVERRVCLAAHASQESVLSFVSLKIPLCLFIGPALFARCYGTTPRAILISTQH